VAPPEPQEDPYSQERINEIARAAMARAVGQTPSLKWLVEKYGGKKQ